jgi:hypothetical protein
MISLKVVSVRGVIANAHLLNTIAEGYLYSILVGMNEYFLSLLLVLYVPPITTSMI